MLGSVFFFSDKELGPVLRKKEKRIKIIELVNLLVIMILFTSLKFQICIDFINGFI